MLEPPTPTLPHKGGGSAPSKRLAGPSASVRESARRHAPFWLSLLAGMALWEIVGRNSSAAFMVPLSEVLVVFLFAVFPILYNTIEGARSIKPELIEVARSFRSSELALWREVMLPYTLPFTMTGVRQAIGRGLVGMVAAEFFLSSTGLGQLIMTASQNFDTAAVFAIILVIGLIGVALTRLGQHIENRYARWRY